MAVVENRFVCDLLKPVQAQALKGNVFSLDNLGSRISVLIYDNGQPATISGSITANCILPDGSTVNVNGSLTTENGGSKAYVDVPQSCLLIPGILKIAIKCTSSSVITTLAAIVANVYMTKTDNVITPSQQIINDWNAEISAAIATQNAAIANQDTKINDLKSATIQKANGAIIDKNNLLEGADINYNALSSNGSISDTSNSDVYHINMTSGTKYYFKGVRFIWDGSVLIYNGSNYENVYSVTAETTGEHLVTVRHGYDAFLCTETNYNNSDYGTRDVPIYNSAILAQGEGQSSKKPVSQKAFTDIVTDFPILNISGVNIKDGTNLMPIAEVFENTYISGSLGNAIVKNTSNDYDAYKIPIKEGTYYFSAQARFTRTANDEDVVVSVNDKVTSVNCSSSAKYLYISVSKSYTSGFMVAYGTSPKETEYVISNLYDEGSHIAEKLYGKGFERVTGDIANGESLTVTRSNIKKNNVYTFTGKITSFDTLLIGRGENTIYDTCYLEITNTKVIIHRYPVPAGIEYQYDHGLTIGSYISVQIIVKNGVADIHLFSNGGSYSITNAYWTGDAYMAGYVKSSGSTLTDCIFTWSCADFRKPVWIFGDSYLGFMSDERWPYYLAQNGFLDNVLLNAYPGEETQYAWRVMRDVLVKYGKPQFIVWCLGMNDGSDTDINTPSTAWKTGFDHVVEYCEVYGITPIFATIPSVPNINHEGKNKFVREIGYRYIDFANAVGAQSNGTWYTGMLSNDNVHPTALGAEALYYQAIIDVPEMTFNNP